MTENGKAALIVLIIFLLFISPAKASLEENENLKPMNITLDVYQDMMDIMNAEIQYHGNIGQISEFTLSDLQSEGLLGGLTDGFSFELYFNEDKSRYMAIAYPDADMPDQRPVVLNRGIYFIDTQHETIDFSIISDFNYLLRRYLELFADSGMTEDFTPLATFNVNDDYEVDWSENLYVNSEGSDYILFDLYLDKHLSRDVNLCFFSNTGEFFTLYPCDFERVFDFDNVYDYFVVGDAQGNIKRTMIAIGSSEQAYLQAFGNGFASFQDLQDNFYIADGYEENSLTNFYDTEWYLTEDKNSFIVVAEPIAHFNYLQMYIISEDQILRRALVEQEEPFTSDWADIISSEKDIFSSSGTYDSINTVPCYLTPDKDNCGLLFISPEIDGNFVIYLSSTDAIYTCSPVL
jgi:hypothetical protein